MEERIWRKQRKNKRTCRYLDKKEKDEWANSKKASHGAREEVCQKKLDRARRGEQGKEFIFACRSLSNHQWPFRHLKYGNQASIHSLFQRQRFDIFHY